MRVALLASIFAFAACDVGEVPLEGGGGADGGGGSADPQASAMYTAMVVPIVGATGKNCTQAAPCHGGGQAPAMMSFETLTMNGAFKTYAMKPGTTNKMVTGPASIDPGTGKHPSPAAYPQAVVYLDATQKATIQMWVDMYGF